MEAVGSAIADELYERGNQHLKDAMGWLSDDDADAIACAAIRACRAFQPPSPLSDRVERLEQALRPFADAPHQVLHWNKETEQHDVVTPPDDEMASIFNVTWGDIRRARAALGDSEP